MGCAGSKKSKSTSASSSTSNPSPAASKTTDNTFSSSDSESQAGKTVKITGLERRSDLNGKKVVIQHYIKERERYIALVDGSTGETVSISAENIIKE